MGWWSYSRYMRGRLVGDTDTLAASDQEYPLLRWSIKLSSVEKIDERRYNVSWSDTIDPILGDGVTFHPGSIEVWGPQPDD